MNLLILVLRDARRFARGVATAWGIAWILCASLSAELAEQVNEFDLPEGAASETLRMVARQGAAEIFVSAELVRGFRTHAVKGRFRTSEVIRRMLQGSGLVVVRHEKSGIYLVREIPPVAADSGRMEGSRPKPLDKSRKRK